MLQPSPHTAEIACCSLWVKSGSGHEMGQLLTIRCSELDPVAASATASKGQSHCKWSPGAALLSTAKDIVQPSTDCYTLLYIAMRLCQALTGAVLHSTLLDAFRRLHRQMLAPAPHSTSPVLLFTPQVSVPKFKYQANFDVGLCCAASCSMRACQSPSMSEL